MVPYRPTDKSYPGDNRLISPRVHIDGEVWHLDVGLLHPGAVVPRAGLFAQLASRAGFRTSWRQFGPYPSRGVGIEDLLLVREDQSGLTAGVLVVLPKARWVKLR